MLKKTIPTDAPGWVILIRLAAGVVFLTDVETQAIRSATGEEARQLIQLNQKPKRRRRDLGVLKLALALFRSLELARHHRDPAQHFTAQACLAQ